MNRERAEQVWGKVRSPAQDKAAVVAKYKAALSPAALKKANLATGRALYVKNLFKADWEAPRHYHLLLDTARLGHDLAVALIVEAAQRAA